MQIPAEIYEDCIFLIGDALRAGPSQMRQGQPNSDFAARLEAHANELEALRALGSDEARRAAAIIDAFSTEELESSPSFDIAMEELGEYRAQFLALIEQKTG